MGPHSGRNRYQLGSVVVLLPCLSGFLGRSPGIDVCRLWGAFDGPPLNDHLPLASPLTLPGAGCAWGLGPPMGSE